MSLDPTHTGTDILMRVQEGMKVYDAENHHVGKVRRVQMSGGNDPADADRQAREAIGDTRAATAGTGAAVAGSGATPAEPGAMSAEPGAAPIYEDTLLGGVAEAFSPGDDLPEELRARLLREGFVQIDSTGIFKADRFATPEQIADVADEGVMLNVTDDQLMKK
jgi:hypothetical protein